MKKITFFLSMLMLLTISTNSVWGATYTLGWGNATSDDGSYTNFTATSGTVNNIVSFSTAKESSSTAPAYNSTSKELRLYYNAKGDGGSITLTPAAGVTITGFLMLTSTTPSVKYSVDGGTATAVSANTTNKTYTVTNISASSSLKIQNVNTTNTQLRISKIQITYSVASDVPQQPSLSLSKEVIDFGTVEKGDEVNSQSVVVTYANLTGAVSYSGLSGAFSATGTISNTGDQITITPNTSTVGEYSQTLTVQSSFDNKSATVTVTMNVVEPFDGRKLTFDVSSNPGEWPTANSTTTTNYTYTLNEEDYTFALNNVKCNSGYLMLTATAKLGLPALSGYKLVKVEATNSSGCSTSTKVAVTSDEKGTEVSGGAAQTFATTSTKYTYSLSGTQANTVYYLYVTNKNCQLTEITLYYEEAAAPAVENPTISGEANFTTTTTVTLGCTTDGATIYYTTDGSDPKNGTTYSTSFTLNATTTVKAIAKVGNDWSSVASKTFTKVTPLTVAQARSAIDAGGDLTNKYVSGTISQIDSYNSTYHSITYWISDDETTTNQLEV